jgi:Putative zincin peptidase
MFFIPGPVIAALTFPGVIIHEVGHLFFCKLFKLQVYDVCFFRFGNPAGYVVHEQTENFTALFFVSLGPFFANTLLCMVFCTAAFLPVWELKVFDPLAYFFYWLGLSIGMHAFPSTADLSNLWDQAPGLAKKGNPLAIISLPFAGLLFVLNMARVIWADLGYGIAVGILGPIALFRALAR